MARCLLACVLLSLMCAHMAVVAAQDPALASQLQKQVNSFEVAFAKKDASGAASFFDSAGVFMSAGNAPFVGQSAIEMALQGLLAEGACSFDIGINYAGVIGGGFAFAEANYVKHACGGSVMDEGFTSFVFKQDSGVYKAYIATSVDNSTSSTLSGVVTRGPMSAAFAKSRSMRYRSAYSPLQSALQAWCNAFDSQWAQSNSAMLADMFTSDGRFYATHVPGAYGTSVIGETLQGLMMEKGWAYSSSLVMDTGVSEDDSTAFGRGAVSFYLADGTLDWAGNFLAIFQKDSSGDWKAFSLTANPSQYSH